MFSLPMALFLSVGALALFSFIAVASWSDSRRKEREAFYKAETIKKLAEMSAAGGGNAVVEMLREQDRIEERRKHEKMKLDGLITAFVGLGLGVFLFGMHLREGVFLVGAIPFGVGLAELIYAYVLSPQD